MNKIDGITRAHHFKWESFDSFFGRGANRCIIDPINLQLDFAVGRKHDSSTNCART